MNNGQKRGAAAAAAAAAEAVRYRRMRRNAFQYMHLPYLVANGVEKVIIDRSQHLDVLIDEASTLSRQVGNKLNEFCGAASDIYIYIYTYP